MRIMSGALIVVKRRLIGTLCILANERAAIIREERMIRMRFNFLVMSLS